MFPFIFVLMTIGSLNSASVIEGNFTVSGDEDDYVTGGSTYTYSPETGDIFNIIAHENLRGVSVWIDAYNSSDNWSMDLQAPSGETLVVGEFLNATRYPFNSAGPGVSISGNGRGCNTLTGSFVIVHSSFGPNGEVNRLEATFEQHCEGGSTALRGSVKIGWNYCDEPCDEICGDEPCDIEESSEAPSTGHMCLCDYRRVFFYLSLLFAWTLHRT